MVYNVKIGSIAQDINNEVRNSILLRLQTYDFPYVSTVPAKKALQNVFRDHFTNKRSLEWLESQIAPLAVRKRGVKPTAWNETNRLHTGGLADVLLSKGETQCTTIHTYGKSRMDSICRKHIEGKTLEIKTILENSFPKATSDLNKDVPMIPQHVNCRHVMAPINDKIFDK